MTYHILHLEIISTLTTGDSRLHVVDLNPTCDA